MITNLTTPTRILMLSLLATLIIGCGKQAAQDEATLNGSETGAETSGQLLFEGLGPVHMKVSTDSEQAQKYFDQGLALAWAFNHAAADLAFTEAASHDPECAMCYWGSALVLGPNLNMPMMPENNARARVLADEAMARIATVSEKEAALIHALDARYQADAPADRSALDQAYAEAMRVAASKYPQDPNVAALNAEALMDLHPWDFYLKDGTEQPWTGEITDEIERALALDAEHTGAIHLYIHAVEASRSADRAEPYADKLADLAPSAGHLVHMPSHIYIRVGRYYDGTINNMKATDADAWFTSACHTNSFMYLGGYVPHNWHFGAISAALAGWQEEAHRLAAGTRDAITEQMLNTPGFSGSSQMYASLPLLIAVRFSDWERILATPEPAAGMYYWRSIWHFARGQAYIGQGQLEQADSELAALSELATNPELLKLAAVGRASVENLMSIATMTLKGNLLAARGDFDSAMDELSIAISLEDRLPYSEPPVWYPAVRQSLGAVQLAAGQATQAEATYLADLQIWPENGWSLSGLTAALTQQGRAEDAAQSQKRFEKAWQHADTVVSVPRRAPATSLAMQ